MAYEESIRSITLNADATLAGYTGVPGLPGSADPNSGKQYRFVKVTGAHECGLATGAAGELVIGVLQNKPQVTGAAATVAIRGVSMVEVGGSVNAGDPVKVDADGQAVKATLTGQGADDYDVVVGVALGSATTATHIIPVLLRVNG